MFFFWKHGYSKQKRTGFGTVGFLSVFSHYHRHSSIVTGLARWPVISPLRRPPPPLDPNQRIRCPSTQAERRTHARGGGCRTPPLSPNLPGPHFAGHRPRTSSTVHARLLSTCLLPSLAVSVSCRSDFTVDYRPTVSALFIHFLLDLIYLPASFSVL